MVSWTQDPDAAATSLILSALGSLDLGHRVLVADRGTELSKRLQAQTEPIQWNRRVASSGTVSPDPPTGFSSALLRLPKSRDEQLMTAHQCIGALELGGCLYVYGGNSEGIRTFQKALSGIGSVETIAARGHGRILLLKRDEVQSAVKGSYLNWREVLNDPPGWVTYPGLFAAGAPDPGTALLIQHLPDFAQDARILDYGCGPGAISAAVRRHQATAQLTLIDNDSIALAAAKENVPGATLQLGANLEAVGSQIFDFIISNPPLHAGFHDDLAMLYRLIADAPRFLTEKGTLVLVVQRRIALDRALGEAFAIVDIVADDRNYRVWRARGAKRPQTALKRRQ